MISLCTNSQAKITPDDLKISIGSWEGTITYLDYQTNEPYTMPTNLVVRQGKNENILVLNYRYPKEPKANSSDKIKIGKNGFLLNKNKIKSREELEDGTIQIQTEHMGKDDKRKALIRYTYSMSSTTFVIQKEVQFNKEEEWIKRNEFNFSKQIMEH